MVARLSAVPRCSSVRAADKAQPAAELVTGSEAERNQPHTIHKSVLSSPGLLGTSSAVTTAHSTPRQTSCR